jgi:cytidylate kinase
MIIAIDGPVAAGKGTLARSLARHFGFAYLDSGSLYRAAALKLLRAGSGPFDAQASVRAAQAVEYQDLADPALRAEAVGEAASRIAAWPGVRAALLHYQREFAHKPPGGAKGAVLDGRDIGTVVCPDADIKIFVTASPAVRAERRRRELKERLGDRAPTTEQILADLMTRDQRDQDRAASPLKPADDAHLLDTTNLAIEAAFAAACAIVARKIGLPNK